MQNVYWVAVSATAAVCIGVATGAGTAFVNPASTKGAEGATVPPGGNVKVGIGTLVCSGIGGRVPMDTGNVPGNGILTPPVRNEDTLVK